MSGPLTLRNPATPAGRPAHARKSDPGGLPWTYWRLWASQFVSLFGSQMGGLALPLLALTSSASGPAGVGLVTAARYLPVVVLAIPAGALADRWPQRRVMVACDLARSAVLAGVLVAAATIGISVVALAGAAFVGGTLTALFDTAAQAHIVTLTTRRKLIAANRWLQSSQSVSDLAGPAAAGAVIGWAGAAWALCVDVATFVASALLLLRNPGVPTPGRAAHGHQSADQHGPDHGEDESDRLTEGIRLLLRDSRLRALTLEAAFFNLFDQGLMTLFLVYSVTGLGLGASGYGLVLSAAGIGTLTGALLSDWAAARWGIGTLLIASGAIACAGNLLIPAVSGRNWAVTVALALGLFLSGISTGVSNVQSVTLRQLLTPPRAMGRMSAAFRAMALGTIPLGASGAGLLGDWLGIRTSLWIFAAATLTTPLWLLFSPIRSLRELSEVST